jgi:hypothetical protein
VCVRSDAVCRHHDDSRPVLRGRWNCDSNLFCSYCLQLKKAPQILLELIYDHGDLIVLSAAMRIVETR